MIWLDGITDSVDMGLSKPPGVDDGQGSQAGLLQSMGSQRVGHDLGNEQQCFFYNVINQRKIHIHALFT